MKFGFGFGYRDSQYLIGRYRRVCLGISVVLFSGVGTSYAQRPIDPIKRQEEKSGSFFFAVDTIFQPSSKSAFVTNSADENYLSVYKNNNYNLSFSVGYNISPSLNISAEFAPSLWTQEENRTYADRKETLWDKSINYAGGLALNYRPDPKNAFDPRIAVQVSYPWGLDVNVSGSYIRDPMILSAHVGYNRSLETGSEYQTGYFGAGLGFLANEKINISLGVNQTISMYFAGTPSTNFSLKTGYSLNPQNTQEISVKTNLRLQNGNAAVGFGLGFSWK